MVGRLLAAVAVFVFLGCGGPVVPTRTGAPTPSPTPSMGNDHPTGATDVVLRMSSGGGLPLNVGPTYTRPADFSLYADGRVIYLVDAGQPPRLMQAQLSDERAAEVIEYALSNGGLATARPRYDEPGIFDAATTRFEITSGAIHKVVEVYAVGFFRNDGPDQEARRGFADLALYLVDFESGIVGGGAVDLGEFEPQAYEITLDRRFGPEITANSPWPWTDLRPVDFGAIPPMGSASRQVSAAQGATVLVLGLWNNLIVTGPDAILYQIKIRPLLPDEIERDAGQGPLLELPLANAGR